MAYSVGVRVPVTQLIAKCSGEECRNVNVPIEMGKIYEVRAKVTPKTPFTPNDIPDKLYSVISSVRKQYPGVIINYISVSEDGSEVIVQLFDPKGSLGFYAIIAVLILILAILVVAYEIGYMLIYGGGRMKPSNPFFWLTLGAGIAVPVFSVAYLIRSFKRKR